MNDNAVILSKPMKTALAAVRAMLETSEPTAAEDNSLKTAANDAGNALSADHPLPAKLHP